MIGLSAYPRDYLVYAMQKAGASEVVGKENVMDELYGAIQRAVASTKRILIFREQYCRGGTSSRKTNVIFGTS